MCRSSIGRSGHMGGETDGRLTQLQPATQALVAHSDAAGYPSRRPDTSGAGPTPLAQARHPSHGEVKCCVSRPGSAEKGCAIGPRCGSAETSGSAGSANGLSASKGLSRISRS